MLQHYPPCLTAPAHAHARTQSTYSHKHSEPHLSLRLRQIAPLRQLCHRNLIRHPTRSHGTPITTALSEGYEDQQLFVYLHHRCLYGMVDSHPARYQLSATYTSATNSHAYSPTATCTSTPDPALLRDYRSSPHCSSMALHHRAPRSCRRRHPRQPHAPHQNACRHFRIAPRCTCLHRLPRSYSRTPLRVRG